MALQIISVLLFTVFFSKALTLECYNCTIASSGTCTQTANCSSNSLCSYMSTYSEIKSCINSTLCANWTMHAGQYNMVSRCCASDRCNNAPAADPDNELTCYTCTDTNCSKTLKCKGVENQCITATVGFTNSIIKGCASQNLCNNSTLVNLTLSQGLIVSSVSCCGGNLCNNMTQGPVNIVSAGTNTFPPFFHLRSGLGGFLLVILVFGCSVLSM